MCIDYSAHHFTATNLYVVIPNLYFSAYLCLNSPKSMFAHSSSISRNVTTMVSYVCVFLTFSSDKKILIS